MKKPDQSRVEYIVVEKRKGTKNAVIAEAMGISVWYVPKPCARFKNTPRGMIVFSATLGRPRRCPIRNDLSIVLEVRRHIRGGGKPHMQSPKDDAV